MGTKRASSLTTTCAFSCCIVCSRSVHIGYAEDSTAAPAPASAPSCVAAACAFHISKYAPRSLSSSACTPRSTISPALSTTISSACTTVLSRCAMTSEVLLWHTRSSDSWIARSVSVSSAEVASSSMTTSGRFRMVRAMATLCFSPPDSLRPRSPTMVSNPLGKPWMELRISAPSAAASTSASVAPRRPYRMLYRTVSWKRTVSCGTTPITPRRESSVQSAIL
mmetsp:Transcript_23128/g.60436  ORF Transcript_23128/g.60436 Transcript_23128/m.60436 type:complete len:223 (-) Transcript_23128:694-1362(-)